MSQAAVLTGERSVLPRVEATCLGLPQAKEYQELAHRRECVEAVAASW